jgi:hypothetical protein
MKRISTVGIFQLSIASAVSAIAIAGAAPAQAATFVSTFRPPGTSTEIGTVDPITGAYTTYGTYRNNLQLTDIAVNNAGTVYGSTYNQLYILDKTVPGPSIDAAPGANFTISSNSLPQAFGFNGLAFDNKNNLYGLAGVNPNAATPSTGIPGFYKIDANPGATFGAAQLIGGGLGSLAPTAYGLGGDTSDLAYNPNNNTFFAVTGNINSRLFTIDPTNGATQLIGDIKIAGISVPLIAGLTYEGGILRGYTALKQQIVINTANGNASLSTFNLTGTLTGIPTTGGNNLLIGGAASTPVPSTAVPEPFTIVGTMIGVASAWKMRKRLKATNKI